LYPLKNLFILSKINAFEKLHTKCLIWFFNEMSKDKRDADFIFYIILPLDEATQAFKHDAM